MMDRRSNSGQPLTLDYFLEASSPEPNSGCWIWTKAMRWNGYGVIKHAGKTHSAHRLAYSIATGKEIDAALDVCHKCDNRLCVNPDHLFLGTRLDNMQDAKRKGRIKSPQGLSGDNCPNSKLRSDQVRKIRTDRRSSRALAKVYGVNKGTILSIRRGATWKTV